MSRLSHVGGVTSLLLAMLLTVAMMDSTLPVRQQSGSTPSEARYLAGFRASRLLNNYPGGQFPSADYWISVGGKMAAKFAGAAPGAVWIVSLYQEKGYTKLDFPASGGRRFSFMRFSEVDHHEAYLDQLDAAGFKVWLQVEPGGAKVERLIDLVLNRYQHHPCVAGFGVDVEWYDAHRLQDGRKVKDGVARRWERRVQTHNPGYTLFLKHWDPAWMPPTHRGQILFVDDSLDHPSLAPMVDELAVWGKRFAPNPVAFQIGYPVDERWWGDYADPPKAIGAALITSIPNLYGIFWVDFTITKVFPLKPPGSPSAP